MVPIPQSGLLETYQHSNETEFRALKILSSECYDPKNPIFEREILTHLLDDFEHHGPNGTHVCLVFELMGETLRSFGTWFFESRLPNSVMRRFTIQLLLALDFAHDHNVIHTDIKPDNIFVKFRDYSLIESGYLVDVPIPQHNRTEKKYSAVPSTPLRRYYFNDADTSRVAEFDIALGDWGVSSWATQHLSEKIQPVALRSPEVLIEAPWDATTDWWNLGTVVFEVFRAIRMFSGRVHPHADYELKEHLAEIVDLFGPFPKEVLEKGNQGIVQRFFSEDGRIKDSPPLNRPGLSSEVFVPDLDQSTRDEFVSFLQALMKINPTDRLSTADLLRQPWLDALK